MTTTPRVAAPCGPDWLQRHATSVSDLDGDGALERVSIVREAGALVVRVHELPSFHVRGSWKLPDGYVEVATPRRRDSTRGDLWITVGQSGRKPWDGAATPWSETLYHLENGQLAAITTGYRDVRIGVDVDGDGRVDPIGSDGTVRALLGTTWVDVPVVLPDQIHGAPIGNDQEEAVDLDGNGVRELVLEQDDGVAIVEVPAMRVVWKTKGKPWKPSLVRWGDAFVLVVRLDDKLRIYATDASHALLAEYPDAESYSEVPTALDLGAGPSRLVMTGHPLRLFDRTNPTHAVGALDGLAWRLDNTLAPVGPVRLAPTDAPGVVATDQKPFGPLQVLLLDPRTLTVRRRVWQSQPMPEPLSTISVSLVDLDGDGTSELLVGEMHQVVQHHGFSWSTARMRLLDGAGALLCEEPAVRTEEWTEADPGAPFTDRRQTKRDGTHVRAFDLGDGTMPLRVRSETEEYYVLAASSKITAVPACLE